MYERDDASSPTGVRLDLPLGALPVNFDGIEIDPVWINRRTGSSPMTQILLTFPAGVDDAHLVGFDDIAASPTRARRSSSICRPASEVDRVGEQVLYLRPATRLAGNTRYVAAIRKSLRGKDGQPLPISDAFRAMLDGRSSGHARFDARRDRYPAAFAALAAAGVPKDDLVVAFDFDTADDDALLADPLAARDAAMAVVGDAESVPYTITSDVADPEPGIARIVRFEYETPEIADLTGAGFHRDADERDVQLRQRRAREPPPPPGHDRPDRPVLDDGPHRELPAPAPATARPATAARFYFDHASVSSASSHASKRSSAGDTW